MRLQISSTRSHNGLVLAGGEHLLRNFNPTVTLSARHKQLNSARVSSYLIG